MRQYNDRFEKHINKKIAADRAVRVTDRHGMILSYNPRSNTATVALSGQDSDVITDILKEVPCPTYHGVQMSAPEAGRHCYIVFKGGRESQPMITHYYNHDYKKYDHYRMSNSHSSIPKYLTY